MKAAYIEKTGSPDVIQYGDLPTPQLGAAQVLVRVQAVSVNPIDLYLRSGAVPPQHPFPYIPGFDFAGVVEALGPGATRFKQGDRVWGTNQGFAGRQGTFAEYVAVDEAMAHPAPDGVEPRALAACAAVGITAHIGLTRHARLRSGDTLYVSGGAGGVGSMVVQMAKIMGARVATTAGSAENLELCRKFGADLAINYKEANLAEALKQFAPQGINVWWELTRELNFEILIPLMAKFGRIVLMAGRDAKPVFPVGPFYTRDLSVLGFAMFNATNEEQQASAREIGAWLAAGKLKPHIGRVMKLSEAAAAHQLQEDNSMHHAGTLSGKIILEP